MTKRKELKTIGLRLRQLKYSDLLLSHRIRERTDALDAAGNTTAAIGKGFAIGSTALVSLALCLVHL